MVSTAAERATSAFKYNDSSNHNADSDDGSFTVVTSRRKRRQQERRRGGPIVSPVEALQRAVAALRSDKEWLSQCTKIVCNAVTALPSPVARILCLGLGSPIELTEARFQLAFLLELRDVILPSAALAKDRTTSNSHLNEREAGTIPAQAGEDSETRAPNPVPPAGRIPVCAFDPVFSSADTALLASLGIEVLPEEQIQAGTHFALHNASDGAAAPVTTLAYMPHCDRVLYEQLFVANWAPAPLKHLLLIGNELCSYPVNPAPGAPGRTRAVKKELGSDSPDACVVRIAPLMACVRLPEPDACPRAFSSTAVQHITLASLPAQGQNSEEEVGQLKRSSFWDVPQGEVKAIAWSGNGNGHHAAPPRRGRRTCEAQ